jgi:glycosyltransferase involved in cell wall biosynthesis
MDDICFFVHSLDSGGIENYLLRFLQCKHTSFNQIYVYCKSGRAGQLESDYLALPNVTIIKQKHSYYDFLSYRLMRAFFKEKKIQVACDFTGNFAGIPMLVAKLAGVNARVSFYRSAMDAFQQSALKKVYSKIINYFVFKFSTTILSNSEAAFDYFYKIDWRSQARFRVIPNGLNADSFADLNIDLREQLNIPKGAYVVGHSGRFNHAKNHETIIQVAAQLIQKHPDIYFMLCGNGVKENLKALVKDKGLDERLILFENRSDIPIFLNTLDCYFFPSTREGQPNALIEAMVMGLPFVASDIPPIRETVGEDYALYPAMDVNALALAIENEYLARRGRDIELQQKMIKRFDYKERFDEFYKVLAND